MKLLKIVFAFIILFIALIIPQHVSAEEKVDISFQYGIDGKVQMGKGFPLEIMLTNKGSDLSGDLVIFANPNYRTQGNVVVPVELPQGEEKTVRVSVPGHGDNFYHNQQSNKDSFIRFYKGGWEEGEEVKLSTDKTFRPGYFPENRLVMGVLSDSPDSLNYLKLTKYNAESVEFISLEETDLPEDSTGFEIFDVLLINDFNISTISKEKQDALKSWVRSGGHLMLGSSPGLTQQLGELKDLTVLHISGETSFDNLNFFSENLNDDKPSFSQVEIMTGDIAEKAKVYYSDHSLPMVMNKSFGIGEVTQFAFNVGSQTLSSWDSYPLFWEDVLQKTVDTDIHGQQRYVMEELSSQLGNIVNAFPSSFLPLTALIVLFIVYLILLIPGLYFLLKKLDKRESSWWIIPAVAVIASAAIFLVGAKDRIAGSQTSDVSILSIDNTGTASGYGAVSVLTNSGGDYTLNVSPGGFNPFPLSKDNSYNELNLNDAMVEKGQEQTKVTFNAVEYWSIRSAAGDIPSIVTGKLSTDLKVENQQLIGTINSSLSIDLQEAFLLTGAKAYPLGEIKAGSTVEVSEELNKSGTLISAPRQNIASSVFPGISNPVYGQGGPDSKDSLDEWKQQELLNLMMSHEIHQKNLNQPLLAGFSTDSMISIEMDNRKSKSASQTLITQAVEITSLLEGDFTLSDKDLQKDVSILEGANANIFHNGMQGGENFVAVEAGKYQMTYQLPDQMEIDKISLNKLQIKFSQGDAAFSILNAENGEYMALEDSSITFEENAHEFLSGDGSIVLSFEKTGMENPEVRIPAISLEGEYTK